MNIAVAAIRNPLICGIVILSSLIGGWFAFENMPRFEDPEYIIRLAKVTTAYPGASPHDVMEEVTEPIETALLQIPEVKEISSVSTAGLSDITVEVRYEDSTNRSDLQVIWTKIRNKMRDVQSDLPPGALDISVNDDFGDTFGIYYLLTGPGYSHAELFAYAKDLREEFLNIPGVAKVAMNGVQQEVLWVEVSRDRAAALGLSLSLIYDSLEARNIVEDAGELLMGHQRIAIVPTGNVDTIEDIKSLIITDPATANTVRFGDIATLTRGYMEPAQQYVRFDGTPAIGIGLSNLSGVNVVKMGERVDARLAEIAPLRPAGMELLEYYHQGKVVDTAITSFASNVMAALAIVFVTLLVFMGFRSGIVMGLTVLVTMAATLLVMSLAGIPMHRISLGALIISLGMLVDNGVVVTDDILVGIRQGRDKLDVAREAARKNIRPLLAGTLVGVLAFAPIGLAPGQTAEFTNSLFWVVLISLGLSWVFAFTVTPLLCYWLFPKLKSEGEPKLEKIGWFMAFYRWLIGWVIKLRYLTIIATVAVFATSIWAFKFVSAGFFPASTTPQIAVDVFLSEGTDIERTRTEMIRLEEHALTLDNVKNIQTLIGGGALRYTQGYETDSNYSSYGQLLIQTEDYRLNTVLIGELETYITANFPDAQARGWRFQLGPGGGSKIEAAFSGSDPDVLRDLAEQAKAIMAADPRATLIKDDWRERVAVIQPEFSESKGGRAGITRQDMNQALLENFSGRQRGIFREGDVLIPIISRPPAIERENADDIGAIQITTSASERAVPLAQVIDGMSVGYRDSRLVRTDRILTIKAQSDPITGVLADDLFSSIRADVEAIPIPAGYSFAWEGEFSSSADAQGALAAIVPIAFIAMVLVVVLLFNSIRQPIIIWSVVPLAIVGVVIGLIITGLPLEFMGILGLLSLSGLIIQNSLVLVYSTDELIEAGEPRFDALVDAAASRLRPVTMGAFTTVFGIIPLFFDAFFQSMTVVLAAGLTFATLITLLVTPALYATFFNIKSSEVAEQPMKRERKPFRPLLRAASIAAALFVGACSTVATQDRVEMSSRDALPELPIGWVSLASDKAVDGTWLSALGDDVLYGLVEEALLNNRELQVAAANVEMSRALYRQARSNLLPEISASSGATDGDFVGVPAIPNYSLGVDISWELDVWGRLRAASNRADQAVQASEADFEFAQQSIAAAVAINYFLLIEANAQADVLRQTADALREIDRITAVRVRVGEATDRDIALSKADLGTAEAQLAEAEGAIRNSSRALEILLGRYPEAALSTALPLPKATASPPAGLPSTLLERRPDLLAAERRIASAFHRVDEAKAARLPALSLTASGSGASSQLGDILNPTNVGWQAASNLVAPLFDGGLRKAQLDEANAEQMLAIAEYADAALIAFEEVETALDQHAVISVQLGHAQRAANGAEEALRIARQQYNSGETDLVDTLTIQQRALSTKSEQVRLERIHLENWIAINLALGGHW